MGKIYVTRLTGIITVFFILTVCPIMPLQAEEDTEYRSQQKDDPQGYAGSQLSAQEYEQLTRDKILITRRGYRQIFEPYINPSTPVFVTSDAVINAFHVLFRESISRQEEMNAQKLQEILKLIWVRIASRKDSPADKSPAEKLPTQEEKNAEGANPDQNPRMLRQAAQDRARIVIAVAIKLLGDTSLEIPEHLASIVHNEVEYIRGAGGLRMPEWITATSPGFTAIDYSRYQPRGFYKRSESLQRYFRSVKWLQSIPFRIDNDEELLAILILGKTLADWYSGDYAKRLEIEQWFRCYNDLFGRRNGWDLLMASQIVRSRPADLDTVREYLLKLSSEDGDVSGITDQIGVRSPYAAEPATADFRIITPHRPPDAVLFDRTTSLADLKRSWPSGLEMCAVLGSEFAHGRLAGQIPAINRAAFIGLIDEAKKYFETNSFYNKYFNCIAALIDEAEPDAPAFIKSKIWQTKSCNTALSGWTQIKHTWNVRAKQTAHSLGDALENLPSGFVEPEPEFFARLGELVEYTRDLFLRCGAFVPSRYLVADDLRVFAGLVKEKKFPPSDPVQVVLGKEESAVIDRSVMTLSALAFRHFWPEDLAGRREDVIAQVLDFAKDVEAGLYDNDPAYQGLILENNLDIQYLWNSLGDICRRLEVLAHKQLRGIAFNKRENYFLADFGEKLAAIMLYGGDSYRTPSDDAPSVVDVYHNSGAGGYLHAGIARPRELLVLYPHNGREILCRGGVTPYLEFISSRRLTDAEWQQRLDSDERPETPDWLKPIFAPGDPRLVR